MSEDILIVGAGPTGLTLAIELKRFGLPVRLIDKADHPAQFSQALVVQARTLEQFERYGLAAQAVAQGRPIRRGKFWSEGELVATIDLTRIPSRYAFGLVLPQNETEQILTAHLQALGGEIERQIELTGLEDGADGVAATLQHADSRREDGKFRWVVGCDGAHSAVRRFTEIPFEGDTVAMRFALGDLRLSGKDAPGEDLVLHWRHGGDVLFIAKLKGDLYRVIVIMRAEGHGDEHAPTLEEFNATFQQFGVELTAESSVWCAPFRVNERRAKSYRQGHVFLAGDAAHIHSPAGGQGMNTGIQDAANLAWKLAAVANGADPQILDSYDGERGAIGKNVLRASSFGLRMATAGNSFTEHLRNFVLRHASQFDFVQDAATRIVSETGIGYRESPIVRDEAHAGKLHAGDRMPNAWHEDGRDLLAPLQQARHVLIAVDVSSSDLPPGLNNALVVEVQSSETGWTPPLAGVLGKGPLLYLVRPDGYIGFRGTADSEALKAYARRVGLVPSA